MKKIAVTSTRTFKDYGLLCQWADRLLDENRGISYVLDKGLPVNDLVLRCAREKNIPVIKYSKKTRPDIVLAFWDGKDAGSEETLIINIPGGTKFHIVYF